MGINRYFKQAFITIILIFHPVWVNEPRNQIPVRGLDRRIGHLASMSPQKNERLTPIKG